MEECGVGEDSAEVPWERTQSGLADATGIEVKHVPVYVRPMMAKGYVLEHSAHVVGGRQRRKAYFLTRNGRKEATRVRNGSLDRMVILESEMGRTTIALREAIRDRFPGIPLLAVLRFIDDEGVLRTPEIVSPPRAPRKRPPIPNLEDARRTLERARALERRHDWTAAEAAYQKALDFLPPSLAPIRADVMERCALAAFRGTFQVDARGTFRVRMEQVLAQFQEARDALRGLPDANRGRALRCEAMAAYSRYWLATDAIGKRTEIAEVRRLTSEALRAFETAGEAGEYGRTYNELSFGASCNTAYQDTREATFEIREELAEWGEHAIEFLEKNGDRAELARACAGTVSFLEMRAARNPQMTEAHHRRALECWRRALRLSEEEAYGSLRPGPSLWGDGTEEALAVHGKALEQAREWKDGLAMAYALDGLHFHTVFRAEASDDRQTQVQLYKKALRYALDAKRLYGILGHDRLYLAGFSMGDPLAYYHGWLAELETDREEKREHLIRAREAMPGLLSWAEASGAPRILASEHSFFASVLVALSRLEVRPENQRRLLEEALHHAERGIALAGPVETYASKLGFYHNDFAKILAELSDLADDPNASLTHVRHAIAEKETCLRLWRVDEPFFDFRGDPGGFALIGKIWYELGRLYVRLAGRSGEREAWRKAVQSFETAIGCYEKPGSFGPTAECHWGAAQAHDALGNFGQAVESFRRASEAYNAAAARLPPLRAHYEDHAFFMEAWAKIEEGRACHRRGDCGRANEEYERAATLHRASRRWAYLATNYLAWARLEKGEDLSRKEISKEAINAFREAARLFDDTGRSFHARRKDIEDPEEARLVGSLMGAANQRKSYCQARITLEEARILEAKGDPGAAAETYRLAADRFGDLLQSLESETDQRDMRLNLTLSMAAHSMARAESTGRPDDYRKASEHFEEAANLSPEGPSKMLVRGHAQLSRALEAGARFLRTRKEGAYAAAMDSLRDAETSFHEAGIERAEANARATRLLLDAWRHVDRANRARSPSQKARLYEVVDRILRSAATAFDDAGHIRKKAEVAALLERIGEEREMAASLATVLRAQGAAVPASAYSAPTQTYERPTGLDPIDHADLQVNLILRRGEVRRKEIFRLEMELVNAGRAAARLLRIEDLVPEGFELVRVPGRHAMEGRHLNLKGRRLEPLRTEEVTLVLRPQNRGTFHVRPRVLYLDENGRSKTCQPTPLELTVAPSTASPRRQSRRRGPGSAA